MTTFTRFDQFLADWRAAMKAHPEWRPGQAAFNTLDVFDKGATRWVSSVADIDPFHVNERLPEFLGFLASYWEDDAGGDMEGEGA